MLYIIKYIWINIYYKVSNNKIFIPDVVSTFDQYKKYTIEKYHHVSIKYKHYLSLNLISMTFSSTEMIKT